MNFSRKDLLSVPKRKWDQELTGVTGVYVIPSRRKHESGFACMDFVASTPDGLVRFGGCCDVVQFIGTHFSMDCIYPGSIIHIWDNRYNGTFSVSKDFSSIYFREE